MSVCTHLLSLVCSPQPASSMEPISKRLKIIEEVKEAVTEGEVLFTVVLEGAFLCRSQVQRPSKQQTAQLLMAASHPQIKGTNTLSLMVSTVLNPCS